MTAMQRCPDCGAEIPPDAPQGQCPHCLLQAGCAGPSGTAGTRPLPSPAAFVPPAVAELQSRFPQYELLELLGKGGMGAVYKARQPGLDRLVAIKILPPEVGRNTAFAERFAREARALARLNHPHIVAVHDFGQTEGLFYFVMEYVDGVNLRQSLRAGRLSPQEALAIVPQICEALQFAHDEGVVHRDIKPENILVDKRGRVKIADFGLAKLLGQETAGHGLTGTQQVMGTLRYMAPEQLEGAKDVDHRADIFSLGVVFYELLTGDLPLGRFAPPSKKVQIDVRLDEVVLRALEREPDQRYQHVSEVKTAIEEMSAPGPVPDGPPDGTPGVLPPGLLPRVMVTAMAMLLGGLTMAAGVALAVYAVLSESPQSGPFWGWMGGAFGCFFGGGGALIGALNTYRQLGGAGDLMTMAGGNWLDRVLVGYALFGAGMLVVALAWGSWGTAARYALLLLGVIVVGQSALFWRFRSPYRRMARPGKP
jgi:predicted Ser/Thr protein kinase